MPPISALIPQPCPTVSAVQATVTSRSGPVAWGVVNVPTIGSLDTFKSCRLWNVAR